jgi:hypothetical protein
MPNFQTQFLAVCQQPPSISSINRILRTRAAERAAEELSAILSAQSANFLKNQVPTMKEARIGEGTTRLPSSMAYQRASRKGGPFEVSNSNSFVRKEKNIGTGAGMGREGGGSRMVPKEQRLANGATGLQCVFVWHK